jgi:hypothetical protein
LGCCDSGGVGPGDCAFAATAAPRLKITTPLMTRRQSLTQRQHAITESLDMAPSILELLESINPPAALEFSVHRAQANNHICCSTVDYFLFELKQFKTGAALD